MTGNVNLRLWELTSSKPQDGRINALRKVLHVTMSHIHEVKGVPLPSHDRVSGAGEVAGDCDREKVILATAVMLLPDLKPFHLRLILVSIICDVEEAVTRMSSHKGKRDFECLASS